MSNVEIITASDVPNLLDQIRPHWQAKDLITRVRRLLSVDPSSACQRIFNAAIHDLREKVVIAGLDIATEAAKHFKLPPVDRPEDVDAYSTSTLIDLSYRMGLLSRPEWRRLSRAYEIRRDLEHEDDEYEAGVEDCIYIFKTCVEAVLSRDPVHLLKVTDVKDIVEQPGLVAPDASLLHDYEHAPQPRQEEILRFLVSFALDSALPDVVRTNAHTMLGRVASITQQQAKLSLAAHMEDRLGRNPLDELHARVAHAAGVLPYLRQTQRRAFFDALWDQMQTVGHAWTGHAQHGEILRTLKEVGGLPLVPPELRSEMIHWMILAYMGEPGGYGQGQNRPVFYSNTAAPLIRDLFTEAATLISEDVRACEAHPEVQTAAQNEYVARRFQDLLDLVQGSS